MASASQHRCVFVGNIPYDASEEQLIQILEEVGPVASFRLVTDKETGKPKGYGFCEYKDEETALSARRNLQGYEINGRQLRVDFAENDKNLDRTREQGRGGPGLAANTGDSSNQLQIGISAAMGAASIMAGALGGSQVGIRSNHNGQSVIGNDPLTLYLAQMSRNQLSEVLHQSKEMATQNKNLARELLVSNPHLSKALLQVLIMLRMVPLQMLQLPNMRQVSTSAPQNGQQAKVSAQAQFGLPSLPHNKLHSGVEEGQSSANAQIPLATYQSSHSHFQEPHQTQQTVRPMQSGVTTLPNLPSQQLSISSVTQQNHFAAPSPSTNQMQLHIAQNSKPIESSHLHSENPVSSKASLPASFSARTELKDPRHQPGSMSQGTLRTKGQEVGRSSQMNSSGSLAQITPNLINLPQELKKSNVTPGIREATSHPLRHVKLEDGMGSSIPMSNRPLKRVKSEDGSGVPVPVADRPLKQVKIEERINFPASVTRNSLNATASPNQNIRSVLPIEKQTPQLPPGIDPGILEQVLKLTPEQLSLLPPDQQQEVIQLQKILSNSA